MSILLTDAPGDVTEAWVNIGGIYVQGGARGGNQNGNGDGSGGGRTWLREDPTGWIDLMTLSDDFHMIVEGAVLPAGIYRQFRFIVNEAVIVTEGGKTFATVDADLDALNAERDGDPLSADGLLHCPSCDRSGLKVMCRDGIAALADDETIVIADFDVSQSFGRERGLSGRWVMHPRIHCSDMPLVGEISGTVSPGEGVELPETCGDNALSLGAFTPLATDSESEVWSGHTSPAGIYKIRPLLPGSYDLSYESEIDYQDGSVITFSASVDPGSVEVVAGGTANADYTIDGAACSSGGGD